jgi:formiminotetrahydrofolate cyclodeaminase
VGLIPNKALELAAAWYLRAENFQPDLVLENRLADAGPMGAPKDGGLNEFLDELAAPTATPGGGSAAAAAAAMAAALGAMVAGLAKLPVGNFEDDRRFFAEAVRRDAEAYEGVRAAYKRPKEERGPYVEPALHQASVVPLEVAEHADLLKQRLLTLAATVPEKFSSDVKTAEYLAGAALMGALANVRVTLAAMLDESLVAPIRQRLSRFDWLQ